jgi:DMSO/TMAO reductase YedYZ molybdopterin-dependent catalytic subunit
MPEHDTPGPHPPDRPADSPPWVHGHAHEPNLQTPAGAGDFVVFTPAGVRRTFSPADLAALPYTSIPNCLIVSTGHGVSGPFTFGGVRLVDLLAEALADTSAAWRYIDLVSADGFGTRLTPADLAGTNSAANAPDRPVLLATTLDGAPLTREQGLVRLIVPSETDDALRQVKWLATITVA